MDNSALAEFEAVLSDLQTLNYVNVAALAWLVYDIVLTFKEEVSFIWNTRLSITKMLYLLIRYVVVFLLAFSLAVNMQGGLSTNGKFLNHRPSAPDYPSPAVRHTYNFFHSSWLGNALLMIRVWALYGRSRKVFMLSLCLYICDVCVGIVAAICGVASHHAVPQLPSGLPIPGCLLFQTAANQKWGTIAGFTLHVTFNGVLFALTLYKFIMDICSTEMRLREARRFAPLMSLFIRDGAFYFLLTLVGTVYNLVLLIVLWVRPVGLAGTPLMTATFAVASTRLVHDLRRRIMKEEFSVRTSDVEMTRPPSQQLSHPPHSRPTSSAVRRPSLEAVIVITRVDEAI
ncbi:hypothetical protein JAAARDRAFT_194791 [Jaapia argillacea MUCL 33604]|uniref:DUF6533 domain-containing protein n=1 Tax=Jaapia argillacea MUCL 33604 TaxID=933084 RepID=A0A067PSN5_9AGAM|nr:hypothetical protein JAAARDRAFT_194791 [Jaapia argillacea MUCL 33604]